MPSGEPPTDMLGRMTIGGPPLPPPHAPLPRLSPTPSPGTIVRAPSRGPPVSALGTARRISTGNKGARIVSTPRRSSGSPRKASGAGPKQPLALDLSFGNSPSTTRPFRRVSDESPVLDPATVGVPEGVGEGRQVAQENLGPGGVAAAASREGRLGRRLFARALDPALQEVSASTADAGKRAALSRVGQAWAALDALDAEGELLLVRTMLEKVLR